MILLCEITLDSVTKNALHAWDVFAKIWCLKFIRNAHETFWDLWVPFVNLDMNQACVIQTSSDFLGLFSESGYE